MAYISGTVGGFLVCLVVRFGVLWGIWVGGGAPAKNASIYPWPATSEPLMGHQSGTWEYQNRPPKISSHTAFRYPRAKAKWGIKFRAAPPSSTQLHQQILAIPPSETQPQGNGLLGLYFWESLGGGGRIGTPFWGLLAVGLSEPLAHALVHSPERRFCAMGSPALMPCNV